jgi:two-component system sensor histidine kinase KdpD
VRFENETYGTNETDGTVAHLSHKSHSSHRSHSLVVTAYPFALRRALLNVLVNALQFAPKGSEVEIALSASQGGRVIIEVRDRGPGIPPEQRKRIFDMFVTTRPEGTGLGLFLARTAIQRCGGGIEALPRLGGGTIIRVTL